ncbi:hypothetical protein HAX54_001968 [Datura stramonium]|uniref:Uncharacterized protein n=1 Tax=Datura stramonium TaxID=4076 RepID=A0ABS8T344_DATST|nr:hypothetical protein [Datura stramonium]
MGTQLRSLLIRRVLLRSPEEPQIWTSALNEIPELKRIFKSYNIDWMAETLGKYSMEMVLEFYTNYNCTLQKIALSRDAIKKEPMLDLEYDYLIEALKGIRKFCIEDKLMYFRWMENIVEEAKEEAKWFIGRMHIQGLAELSS